MNGRFVNRRFGRRPVSAFVGVLAVVVGTLLVGGSTTAASTSAQTLPTPFSCDGQFFLGQNGQLFVGEFSQGEIVFLPEGGPYTTTYNGIGYNVADGFIYAIGEPLPGDDERRLLRIGDGGVTADLGSVGITGGGFPAGEVTPGGDYYFARGFNTEMFVIADISAGPAAAQPIVLSQSPDIADITWASGFLWGVQRGGDAVVRIAPDGTECFPTTDVQVVKSVPAKSPAGGTLTYKIEVTNNGPARSSGWSLYDRLPATLANPATSTDGCAVDVDGVLRCTGGPLAVTASATVTVVADAPSTYQDISNTAVVFGNETDPTPDNDESVAVTQVVRNGGDADVVDNEPPVETSVVADPPGPDPGPDPSPDSDPTPDLQSDTGDQRRLPVTGSMSWTLAALGLSFVAGGVFLSFRPRRYEPRHLAE